MFDACFTSKRRKTIEEITPNTKEWSCKVQLIEKANPRDPREGKTRFQSLRFEDSREHHVGAVIFGGEIERIGDSLKYFCTYLISGARVKVPLASAIPVSRYEWVIDSSTVIKEITTENIDDPPLPPPTKLITVPLVNIPAQPSQAEFDIAAAVVSCGSIKRAGPFHNKCREVNLLDNTSITTTVLSLWEDFAECDGGALAADIANFPVIVAKRIKGSSLSTRSHSVILKDPPYPQAAQLRKWVYDNEDMLSTYRFKGTLPMAPTSALVSLHDDITAVADLSSDSPVQVFSVQGEMLLPNREQDFYELLCSQCGHWYRKLVIDEMDCFMCNSHTRLMPRVKFEVEIRDNSGSVRAALLGDYAERLLGMTAMEVYNTIHTEGNKLPLDQIKQRLHQRLFQLQVKKMFSRTSGLRLSILSFVEKPNMLELLPSTSHTGIGESSGVSLPDVTSANELNKDFHVPAAKKQELAPLTPAKKL